MHSESQWRYRASRLGLRLVKYKESSPAYEQYGPYALFDRTTNKVVRAHLSPAEVELHLFTDTGEGFAPATGRNSYEINGDRGSAIT